MPAWNHVIEAGRLIPGQRHAAFVVRVEGEELAVKIEIHAVSIAKAVSDDLAVLEVRSETQYAASHGVVDRRGGQRCIGLVDAAAVAAQDIEPAIRATMNGVGAMFAAGLHSPDQLGRSIRLAIAILITKSSQTAVARDVERVVFPQEAHGAILGVVGKLNGTIGPAVVVVIDQDANVTAPGDN